MSDEDRPDLFDVVVFVTAPVVAFAWFVAWMHLIDQGDTDAIRAIVLLPLFVAVPWLMGRALR